MSLPITRGDMRILRTLVLLVLAFGFSYAGYAFGATLGTAGGLLLWGMAGGAVLMTVE